MEAIMRNSLCWLIATSALAFSVTATAEIVTQVKPISKGLGSFAGYSVENDPCQVHAPGLFAKDIPQLRKALKDAKLNTVEDDKASCYIQIGGYVTVQGKDTTSVTPVNAEWLLHYDKEVVDVAPALMATPNLERGINGADVDILSRAGGMLSTPNGSVALVAVGAVADLIGGIVSRNKTQPGIAHITAQIAPRQGFFVPSIALDVYAVSNEAQKPSELIRAAIARFVLEVRKAVEEDEKKEAGKNGGKPQAAKAMTEPSPEAIAPSETTAPPVSAETKPN